MSGRILRVVRNKMVLIKPAIFEKCQLGILGEWFVSIERSAPVRLKMKSVVIVAQKGTWCPLNELIRAIATGIINTL